MELYPTRWVFGFPQFAWSLRQWARRQRSTAWVPVRGVVDDYELLLARQNGWFLILYSYEIDGTQYSGEYRKWLLFSFSSQEAQTEKVMKRFPRGAAIRLRVDPKNPARSIVDSQ